MEPKSISLTAQMDITASADAGDGKLRLPRFSMVAYTGGPMRIGEWRYPVIVDLAGLAIASQARPIRFGHDAYSGVGHTDSIVVTDGKLVAARVVSRDTAAAKEIIASARNGFMLWLNGKPVHANQGIGPAPNTDRLLVPVKQGKNTLLVRMHHTPASKEAGLVVTYRGDGVKSHLPGGVK